MRAGNGDNDAPRPAAGCGLAPAFPLRRPCPFFPPGADGLSDSVIGVREASFRRRLMESFQPMARRPCTECHLRYISPCRLVTHLRHHCDHFHGRLGRALTRVAVTAADAVEGLLLGIGGEDAKDDGEALVNRDLLDAARGLAGDVVE